MILSYDEAATALPISDGSCLVTRIMPRNIHASTANSNPEFPSGGYRNYRDRNYRAVASTSSFL